MLRFALRQGLTIPATTLHDLAVLDAHLVTADQEPISELPRELLRLLLQDPVAASPPTAGTSAGGTTRVHSSPPITSPPSSPPITSPPLETPAQSSAIPANAIELLLRVHASLSAVIAPATALTLEHSEPPPGAHRLLGGMPLIVKWAAWVAVIAAAGFVITATPVANQKLIEAKSGRGAASPTPEAVSAEKKDAGKTSEKPGATPNRNANPTTTNAGQAGSTGGVQP